MIKKLLLHLILFYRKYISVIPLYLFGSGCRYNPTCSQYAYQAIKRYGLTKGIRLSVERLLKCHPWSSGGFDPVK